MPDPNDIDELPSDVVDALRRGRKVDAMRMLREAHGYESAAARSLVDGYLAVNRVEQGLIEPNQGPGFGWVITLVAIVAILYALYTYVG